MQSFKNLSSAPALPVPDPCEITSVGETVPGVRIPLSPPFTFRCFSSVFRTKSSRLRFSPPQQASCAEMLSNSVDSQAAVTRVTFPRDILSSSRHDWIRSGQRLK